MKHTRVRNMMQSALHKTLPTVILPVLTAQYSLDLTDTSLRREDSLIDRILNELYGKTSLNLQFQLESIINKNCQDSPRSLRDIEDKYYRVLLGSKIYKAAASFTPGSTTVYPILDNYKEGFVKIINNASELVSEQEEVFAYLRRLDNGISINNISNQSINWVVPSTKYPCEVYEQDINDSIIKKLEEPKYTQIIKERLITNMLMGNN